jgi:hypothetical protein
MSDKTNNDIEIRMLSAIRKTLIAVAKDTMTKPGLRHPLTTNTQKMITDCLNLVVSRQTDIEKKAGTHTKMKPVYTDEQTVQSFSVDDLKKTLN